MNGFKKELVEFSPVKLKTCQKCINLSSGDLVAMPEDVLSITDTAVTELVLDFNDLSEIPASLHNSLPNLEVLSLNGNQICSVPDSLASFIHLKRLELVENELTSIPGAVCSLRCLQLLRLTGNKLKSLPQKFGELTCLKSLHVEENLLKSLPSKLGKLRELTVLEASNNQLQSLPENLGNLTKLQVLNISHNHVGTIPDSFENLPNLEHLDLSMNGIEFLPPRCKSSGTLKKFYAECNQLKDLPDWVNHLPEITDFSVKDNHITQQPLSEDFGENNRKLRVLDISGNFMNCLPESFGKLERLEEFRMGSVIDELERRNFQNGNWIARLPSSFSQLAHLRELYLDENQIIRLPDEFGNLAMLEFIDLGQNMLQDLPDSFCRLSRLRVCQLSKNSIERLPQEVGDMKGLEDLRLDSNQLTELPESFAKLTQLKSLDLFNNKLKEIPPSILKLTNMVRLDLRENKFEIPWQKVPNVTRRNRYAPRDPALKDNWRGKPRADVIYDDSSKKKFVMEPLDLPEEEDTPNGDDPPFNHDVMRRAAESFWRSHSGPATRPIYLPTKTSPWEPQRYTPEPQEDDGWMSSENEENEDEEPETETESENGEETDGDLDLSEDDDLEESKCDKEGGCEGSTDGREKENGETAVNLVEPITISTLSLEEDWDEEIENSLGPYDEIPVYQHPPRDRVLICHEVRNHYFRAWDLHAKPVNWLDRMEERPVEEGQFEDCEDSDGQT